MEKYAITKNDNFNSYEITFDGKPSENIRNILKANGYRWHGIRKIWYGYKDIAEALNGKPIEICDGKNTAEKTAKHSRLASLWQRTRTDDLPGYATDNDIKKQVREEARKNGDGYDKRAAMYIRKHLKERFPEVKFSVTSGGAGYLYNVDIKIISAPYGQKTIKGDPDAYDWRHREDRKENTPELQAVLNYCNRLHDCFDADDGDYYADYGAHHDLYGHAEIDYYFTQTEATPEQLADIKDFYTEKEADEKRKEAERQKRYEEAEKQREADRIESEKRERENAEKVQAIEQHITAEDIPENLQPFYSGLHGGYGKENTIAEVMETIDENPDQTPQRAKVARRVYFTDEKIYNDFCGLFMYSFSFLNGMGGTATDDERVTDENYLQLTAEQRETVHFYMDKCVAVYLNNEIKLIIDPEGYAYARYVYIADGEAVTEQTNAEHEAEEKAHAETVTPFYIPETLKAQAEKADIKPGDVVTVQYNDGFMCTHDITGTVTKITPTTYAQHADALRIEIIPNGKRKPYGFYTYGNNPVMIYKGEAPEIPDDIKYTDLGGIMQAVNSCGSGYKSYMRKCYEYRKQCGFIPVIDTIAK